MVIITCIIVIIYIIIRTSINTLFALSLLVIVIICMIIVIICMIVIVICIMIVIISHCYRRDRQRALDPPGLPPLMTMTSSLHHAVRHLVVKHLHLEVSDRDGVVIRNGVVGMG